MRLLLVPVAAVLLTPVLPVGVAAAEGPPVRVTAVVQEEDGRLTFRREPARDATAGRRAALRWRGDRRVVAAAVDTRVHVTDDPLQERQWGLTALSADELWGTGDASGQVVAVIDTGVDATHPDLAGVVRPGADFVEGGDGRTDGSGHGTHVAGIVAAVGGNGIGVAGLARGATVLPVKVMGADGSGYDSDAARGLVWAVDHGATVANLSLGGPDRSSVMDAAVRYALGKGVTVVVSAGNEGTQGDPVLWPAANAGVVAVGAVDAAGSHPAWSSTGPHLAVAAPGVGILSTVPGGGYASWSGTSMAAPFVSAAAALLRRSAPLTPAQLRERLMATAVDLGAPGPDVEFGAGRIDPLAAVRSVLPAPVPVVPTEPVAPAPAPAAEPPTADAPTADAPTAELPVPDRSAPAPTADAPAPDTVAPADEPAAPVLSARVSVSRPSAPYGSTVVVATRTLADGVVAPYTAVRLERLVGTSWVLTRTATTDADGLARWSVRPDRTTLFRTVGAGWVSPSVRYVVTPTVSLSRTLAGRVLPAAATTIRLQVRRSTGWVTYAYAASTSYGTFRFSRRPATGTVVRAVALGAVSPPIRL